MGLGALLVRCQRLGVETLGILELPRSMEGASRLDEVERTVI